MILNHIYGAVSTLYLRAYRHSVLLTVTVTSMKSGRHPRHELHAAKQAEKTLWQPAFGEQVQHQPAPDNRMQDQCRPQQEAVWHGDAHPREQDSYANVDDKKTYNIAARS